MKYLLFTIAFLLASNCLKAQDNKFDRVTSPAGTQGFPQPNVSNASTYGKIPVGLFTGTPNISIPLYEFQLKDNIRIPVNLNYHIYNVKPNNLPSEVGLGWNLECGGCITRTIKDLPDTYDGLSDSSEHPFRAITTEQNLIVAARNEVQYPNSSVEAPDEFQFNFLGYSGSFIYNGETNTWMVQSDSNIKIEHTETTYSQTAFYISGPTRKYYNYLRSQHMFFDPDPLESKIISSFTLTTPDGNQYTFGGTTETDYNIPFKGFINFPTPVTWHLSKIITPTGHQIDFFYEPMPLQISGNMSFNISVEAIFQQTAMSYNYELLAPVQLVRIQDSTDSQPLLDLYYSPSTQLLYGSENAWSTAMDKGLVTFFTQDRNFILNQLDSIQILDKIDYKFSYTKNSAERLKLKTLTKITQSGTKSIYSLNYHNRLLPKYNIGHYDNLGFYNGKDFAYYSTKEFFANAIRGDKQVAEGREYTNRRLGDKTGEYVTAEMLKSITYPTKGRTEFIYEPNVISSMVSVDRKTIQSAHLPYPGTPDYTYPGGIRIKQIDNYDSNNALLSRKHYYYTQEFTPANKKGASSGILSFTPQYLWGLQLYNLLKSQNGGPEYYTMNAIMSQASNPLWYNSQGEYIGYSKVIECNEDEYGELIDGYTVHTFSNFGQGYMDEDPIVMLNNKFSYEYPPHVGTPYSPFTPCTSNALKRGMLMSKEQFDRSGHAKQKELFEYTPIQKDSILITEISTSNVIDYNLESPSTGYLRFAFGGSYYQKSYSNLLTEKRTIIYDDNGNTIEYKDKYEYEQFNKMIKLRTSEDGAGNVYEEKTRYVTDMLKYPTMPLYRFFFQICNLHFLEYPLEKTKTKNGKILENETYFYQFHDTNPKSIVKDKTYILGKQIPASQYQGLHYEGNTLKADACTIPAVTYLAYDAYNNPVYVRNEKDKTETVCLYGYKGKYMIAEIKNADYEEVKRLLGESTINRLTSSLTPQENDLALLNKLRQQLPESSISTFKYIPYIGISQFTDSRGVSTYFEYDDSGRLIREKDNYQYVIHLYDYSKNL